MRQIDINEAVRTISGADKRMARLIQLIGPLELEIKPVRSPFRTLAEAIAYQQLTGKAAATILSRFKAIHPGKRFPGPEDVLGTPDEVMRGAGLSRAKVAAIKDLAQKVLDGTVPGVGALNRMDDDEIIERLTEVRGVGRWTVEMLLIFGFGRPDVLPATDYGIRKAFAEVYGKKELPPPIELEEYGERWRPYRTVASLYLWKVVDTVVPS